MATTEKIQIQRSRDFGQMVSLVFEFARQNFRMLLKSLLFILGPVMVVGAVASGVYVTNLLSLVQDAAAIRHFSFGDSIETIVVFGIMAIVGTIASIFMVGIATSFVSLYMECGPDGFDVPDVWAGVKQHFWTIVGTTLFQVAIVVGIAAILMLPGILLRAWWLAFLLPFLASFGLIYFMLPFTLMTPMRVWEHMPLSQSIARVTYLIKGKWWATLGLYIVVGIALYILALVFQIPYFIVSMIATLNSANHPSEGFGAYKYAIMAAMAFSVAGSYLLNSLMMFTICFQYWNLREKKEGTTILQRINEIGGGLEPSGSEELLA